MEETNLFGNRIREKRKEKKLTQKEFAKAIGAKHNSVSDWELGKNKPDPDAIERICEVLDIPADYLLPSRRGSAKPECEYSDALYISMPSGDAEIDELRKGLHDVIDRLSDADLRLLKDLTIRISQGGGRYMD